MARHVFMLKGLRTTLPYDTIIILYCIYGSEVEEDVINNVEGVKVLY